ncbi:MAG: ATP-binding protein [Acidobacteria bacterium]|nr:ATP-binding protein [Acidobacteriota bacterium]
MKSQTAVAAPEWLTPMAKSIDNRFFRDMVASMRNGVLAIARDGTVVVINAEAYRILGLRTDAGDPGRHFSDLLRDHPDLVRVMASAFELSTLPNRAELRLKTSGKVIGYTLALISDERARVRGAALLFKDLTLVEQAEERERLRDRLAALGEMAATIAHEVKNPLASIEVMAGLLRRQMADRADVQGLLSDIINEAKMANAIVLEVLEFVRPIRLQVDRTALSKVVEDAIVMAERKVPRRNTLIDVVVPRDLPTIQGDYHQLCQVVTNLLINALEALGGRGAVRIRAATRLSDEQDRAADIELRISDDGPGIPGEITDRIFNPFFTTKPQGSGLGLAIVRKIVDAHEGRIDVLSAPGTGTTFTIALPVEVPGRLGF